MQLESLFASSMNLGWIAVGIVGLSAEKGSFVCLFVRSGWRTRG